MKESRYNVRQARGDVVHVFNGLTGAVLTLPEREHAAVQDFLAGRSTECPEEALASMARGRMVVSDEFDELAFLKRKYDLSRHDRTRFGLTLVTSLGCNFDCPYCFEAKHHSLLDAPVQELVLRVLDDRIAGGIESFHATWYGGEPLVGRRPLLALSDQFIERCDRAGVRYAANIVTNGSLLTESTCAELRDRRVASAQVTLDGPPEVHDRMRPYVSGRGSFWTIVRNLHHAVDYLEMAIRVNVDLSNWEHVDELLAILAAEGLAPKLRIYPGQLIGMEGDPAAPSAEYAGTGRCFTHPAFARAEREFRRLADGYGFPQPALPKPKGAPCTAVRANDLVVGSKGELYKCWDDVGDLSEVIGHIRDYENTNGRLHKWLNYDPFANEECRGCIALPVCMGGCAHHAMDDRIHDNRCGTFRHTYQEQVLDFVVHAERRACG